MGISNIKEMGFAFCTNPGPQPCKENFSPASCKNAIIYNINNINLFYCFEDKNDIIKNYYNAQNNYNIAKTKLDKSISAAKNIPSAKDNFRKQDRNPP